MGHNENIFCYLYLRNNISLLSIITTHDTGGQIVKY